MSEQNFNEGPKFGGHPEKLLTVPENTTTRRIFIAATRMNEGKTTTSLGLFNSLKKILPSVGYIKPIGQRFVNVDGIKVDEDSLLLNRVYDTDTPLEAMSPVAVGKNFTRNYLDYPDEFYPVLRDRIIRAFDRIAYGKDAVIIEGTGHAGVGSVLDLSNAGVAKFLNAKAIIVSSGGIGRPIDEIAMNKALFDKYGVEIIGAVLNKVLPEKIEQVREYAGKGLKRHGVKLLGVVPMRSRLNAPNLQQIIEEIGGRWINGEDVGRSERIMNVVIGAMGSRSVIDYMQRGTLIIAPGDREDIIFSALAMSGLSGENAISGIILTLNLLPHPKILELISKTNIPVAITGEESYEVASKINSMTVKTQVQDTDKIPIIQDIFEEAVDLKAITDCLG